MKIKQKNLLKINKFAMVLVVLMVLAFQTAILARASVVSYTDPKDDVRCFTEEQLEEYEWDEYPDDPQDITDAVDELWSHGTQSATPDCIDMELVTVDNEYAGNSSVRITIEVEGTIADCSNVFIMFYSNCSDDSYVLGFIVIYTEYGYTEIYGEYYDSESDETNDMTANINEAGNTVGFTMPKTDDDCCFNILMFTYNDAGDVMCADKIKICGQQQEVENPFSPGENPKDTQYNGLDPVTNFFDNLAYLILGLFCGRLPFIFFVTIMLIVGKCLIDRKNTYIRISGWVVDSFVLYMLIWYSIDTFFQIFSTKDPILDFSLLGLIDLFSCLFLIVFVAYTYLNNFRIIGDGEWSWILAYAFMFVETILFMGPWYYYYCSGDPLLTLILLIVALIPCIACLFLTETYSKKRLP